MSDNECTNYFVGLDLSYTGTGVVILSSEGATSAYEFSAGKAGWNVEDRALDLWKQIKRVLPGAKENKVSIVIEGAAYGAEFNAFMLGELNGGIKVLLHTSGYSYELVAPTLLKKYATGSGSAQKTFVAAHIAKKWDFMHKSNNVTDAYVLAKIAEMGVDKVEELCYTKKSKAKKPK